MLTAIETNTLTWESVSSFTPTGTHTLEDRVNSVHDILFDAFGERPRLTVVDHAVIGFVAAFAQHT